MRVTGGKARGVRLQVEKGDRVRPATDRMREAVFSSLGPFVADVRFLDLFAGSGAYGLEALSRGASGGRFVEKDRRSCALIEANLVAVAKSMGTQLAATVVNADVFTWPVADRVDLVFIDPPYALIAARTHAIFALADLALLHDPNARVCFEHPGGSEPSAPGWNRLRSLGGGKGQPTMSIFTRSG